MDDSMLQCLRRGWETIRRPNGVVIRASVHCRGLGLEKMPSCHRLSCGSRASTHSWTRPCIFPPWRNWSAIVASVNCAAHTTSPVEPWPKPSDRGRCNALAAMRSRHESDRDSPPKTHLCAVPLEVGIFALSSFNCTFRKARPWTLFLESSDSSGISEPWSSHELPARVATTKARSLSRLKGSDGRDSHRFTLHLLTKHWVTRCRVQLSDQVAGRLIMWRI